MSKWHKAILLKVGLLFVLVTIPAVALVHLPNRISQRADTYILTADKGSFKRHGNSTSITLTQNVRVTAEQRGSTLLCQQLVANVVQQDITSVVAEKQVRYTMTVMQVGSNGQAEPYRLEVFAATATFSGKIIHIKGIVGTERPRITITPVNQLSKQRYKIVADQFEFYSDAEQQLSKSAENITVPYVKAMGNAILDATVKTGQGAENAETQFKQLHGTAPLITGFYRTDHELGNDTAYPQLFRFERGNTASSQPHMEMTPIVTASPDNIKLDADFIEFHPNAEAVAFLRWGENRHGEATPVLTMKANGHVQMSAIRKETPKQRTTPRKGGAKNGFNMFSNLPSNQSWHGENGQVLYQLEPATSTPTWKSPGFARVLRWNVGIDTKLPHIVLTDRDTNTVAMETVFDQGFYNLDSGEWTFGNPEDEQAKPVGGKA